MTHYLLYLPRDGGTSPLDEGRAVHHDVSYADPMPTAQHAYPASHSF